MDFATGMTLGFLTGGFTGLWLGILISKRSIQRALENRDDDL